MTDAEALAHMRTIYRQVVKVAESLRHHDQHRAARLLHTNRIMAEMLEFVDSPNLR